MSEGKGKWQEYSGGYNDMLAQRGDDPVKEKTANKAINKKANKPKEKSNSNESKLSFNQQHARKTLLEEIERLEFEITKL